MRPLLLAFASALLAAGAASAGDCDACMPSKMCIRHQKEQDDMLKEFAKFKKDKDPMKRKAALDKLGALNDDHMNHRSPEVADAIADMLTDTDSGVRMAALDFLKRNQEPKKSKEELSKFLEKMISKVKDPKPTGKAGASKAALEWENCFAMAKVCTEGLTTMGGKEAIEACRKAMDTNNMLLVADTAPKSVVLRDKDLTEFYLQRVEELNKDKDEDMKHARSELANAFNAVTAFTEVLGDDVETWVKKAKAYWKEHKSMLDPPKDPPPDPPK